MPTTATYTRPFHLTASSEYSTFGSPSSNERMTRQTPLIIKKTENLRPFTYFAYTTNDSVEDVNDFGASDTSSEDESVGMNHVSQTHVFERIKTLLESLRSNLRKLALWAATPHPPRRASR